MQRIALCVVTIVLLMANAHAASSPRDTILNRAERYLRAITPITEVGDIVSLLDEQGRWPDIDYTDQTPSGWDASLHLQRLRSMSLAWTTPGHRDARLKNAIDLSLQHWLEKRYQNPNWWHNQIGIPRMMQDIIVLLRRDLNAQQFKGCMEVLAQHKIGGIGANLIWSADLGLHYGVLSQDDAMVRRCSDLISNEIRITTQEGIQPDYSYHQHGARLQTFHYGAAFLRENIKLAWELRGTPWEFSRVKTEILLNYVLQGWQWMARGIHTVPGTIDRSVTRKDALRNADIRNLLPFIEELDPGRGPAFRELGERQDGKGKPLNGFKHYPYSDFSAYHHDDFSFFVKTISKRTRFSESINGENLKGRLLNSGDAYFIRDGNEYFNLMPVWDWEHLPGITSFRGAETKPENFTGGVSSGSAGLTVMRHTAEHDNQRLSVNKIWAAHGDAVVCLQSGAGISNVDSTFTVLDQCRWRGAVNVNSPGNVVSNTQYGIQNAKWIYHSGLAYIPLGTSRIDLHVGAATGSWSEINRSGSTDRIVEKVFMPVMLHDSGEASSGYAVMAVQSPKDVKSKLRKRRWRVVRNDAECQAVLFDGKTLMAAFFSPAVIESPTGRVAVDRPCLIIVSEGKVFASDPAHEGGPLNVLLNGKSMTFELGLHGETISLER